MSYANHNRFNSTISGNSRDFGGEIMQHGGTLLVRFSTIASNSAREPGGGITVNSGTVNVQDSIIAKNRSDFPAGKNCSDPVTSGGHNLENGMTCGFDEPTDPRGDARLGPLPTTEARRIPTGSVPAVPRSTRVVRSFPRPTSVASPGRRVPTATSVPTSAEVRSAHG